MTEGPRVALLTRADSGGCYIACRMSESRRYRLMSIVTESRIVGQWQLLLKKLSRRWKQEGFSGSLRLIAGLPLLYREDRRLGRYQTRQLWPEPPPAMPVSATHEVFDDLNDPAVRSYLAGLSLDYIVVYGTRILKRSTYGQARRGALNIHLGITPEYRGSKSEFWALYDGDTGRVGLTVHSIDDGIDTGAVLAQHYLSVSPLDDERSLRVKNIQAAAEVIEQVITGLWEGQIKPIDTVGRESRFYSTPSPSQYAELHRRLRRQRSNSMSGASFP